MKKDFLIPQGKYKVGRDIPEGVYLIAAINELSFITIDGADDKYEHYTLNDENSAMCHTELDKGDTVAIDGKVKVRAIAKFKSEDSGFSLLSEIEEFQQSLNASKTVKKNADSVEEGAHDEDNRDYGTKASAFPKNKVGFWSGLRALLSSSPSSSNGYSNSGGTRTTQKKKKDTGRCDGDCANCPPHYGYRYGRWYYGHAHQHGCQRGGNGGASGKCSRD